MLVFCRFVRLLYSGAVSGEIADQDTQRILGFAHVAQSVEHVLGKDEVISSILIMGSILEVDVNCGSGKQKSSRQLRLIAEKNKQLTVNKIK